MLRGLVVAAAGHVGERAGGEPSRSEEEVRAAHHGACAAKGRHEETAGDQREWSGMEWVCMPAFATCLVLVLFTSTLFALLFCYCDTPLFMMRHRAVFIKHLL